ncbi:MAG: hypothetical protein IIB41_06670 [Candidatus Marinimicrobia bacterium]|nr:hypothetical protein [Candidatus Neomarinimicrobiota bacterium]
MKEIYILKKDLISHPDKYGIKALGNNIRSTLHYYEREKIIPSPLKIALGGGQGTLSVYLIEILEILSSLIDLKKSKIKLDFISRTLIEKHSEYYLFNDLFTLANTYSAQTTNIVNAYLNILSEQGKLTQFRNWLNKKFAITDELYSNSLENAFKQSSSKSSLVQFQLYDMGIETTLWRKFHTSCELIDNSKLEKK